MVAAPCPSSSARRRLPPSMRGVVTCRAPVAGSRTPRSSAAHPGGIRHLRPAAGRSCGRTPNSAIGTWSGGVAGGADSGRASDPASRTPTRPPWWTPQRAGARHLRHRYHGGRPTALSVTLAALDAATAVDAATFSVAVAARTPPRNDATATLSATIATSDTATATDGVASATIATSDTATTTDARRPSPSRSPPPTPRRRSGCGQRTRHRIDGAAAPGMWDHTDTAALRSAARTQAPRQTIPDPRGELSRASIDNGRRHGCRGGRRGSAGARHPTPLPPPTPRRPSPSRFTTSDTAAAVDGGTLSAAPTPPDRTPRR